jgi:hypothetical protein
VRGIVVGSTLLACVGCGGAVAWGHPLAPSLLEVREEAPARALVSWKRPLTATDALQPVLPAACTALGPPSVRADEVARTVEVAIECPNTLVGEQIGIAGLAGSRADVLLRIALLDGRVIHHVLRPGSATFRVPERPGALAISSAHARLGLEHIAAGTDHLLFLLGLLVLAPDWRRLAGMVTAFTAGHALTLSLAAVGRAPLPTASIEVLIALTILILAYELTGPGTGATLLRRHPAVLTFGFGLLHGLGFAGALREAGLPEGEVVLALLGFNGGIEAGQLAFVLGLAVLRRLTVARRAGWRAGRVGLAYAIGSVAACLVLERAVVLLR